MTHSSTTTPLPDSSRSQAAVVGRYSESQTSRSQRVPVHLIRAYLILGSLAILLGLYILLNPELSASTLPLARLWLRRLQVSVATLMEFYYVILGWLLLLGGALLLVGGAFVGFLLSKERHSMSKAAAVQ